MICRKGGKAIYRLSEVTKRRATRHSAFELRVSSLVLADRDLVALVGVSGSGKSTLLDLLSMTLMPTGADQFRLSFEDHHEIDLWQTWQASRRDVLAGLRRRFLGYVLQTGGLLPYLSVRGNISLPRRLLGLPDDGTVEALTDALAITPQLNKRPADLSVGERQRVAIARALSHRPKLIIADEPTASVDPLAAAQIVRMLVDLAGQFAAALVVATHDWTRLEPLGFRRLHHDLQAGSQHGVTVATFSD